MKRFFSQKVIIAVLSICILVVSIGLFAASPDEIIGKCNDFCSEKWGMDVVPWMACMDGCLYGASL